LDVRFYSFLLSVGGVFLHEDFGANGCFFGRRGGISPWLIAIFGESMDILQSALHHFLVAVRMASHFYSMGNQDHPLHGDCLWILTTWSPPKSAGETVFLQISPALFKDPLD
jgi:hypothetical protein